MTIGPTPMKKSSSSHTLYSMSTFLCFLTFILKGRTGGWVGLETGQDDVEGIKILPLPGIELRPLDRPGRSQSL
jgi:hypothetical protein